MSSHDAQNRKRLQWEIVESLKRGGYSFRKGVSFDRRLGEKRLVFDVASDKLGRAFIVYLMSQDRSGTTEEKVPFKVICLADVMRSSPEKFQAAYLILGGMGWTLMEFYLRGGLLKFIESAKSVNLVDFDYFVTLASKGQL